MCVGAGLELTWLCLEVWEAVVEHTKTGYTGIAVMSVILSVMLRYCIALSSPNVLIFHAVLNIFVKFRRNHPLNIMWHPWWNGKLRNSYATSVLNAPFGTDVAYEFRNFPFHQGCHIMFLTHTKWPFYREIYASGQRYPISSVWGSGRHHQCLILSREPSHENLLLLLCVRSWRASVSDMYKCKCKYNVYLYSA